MESVITKEQAISLWFSLTIKCRDAWVKRDKEKGSITFDELINALN